MLVRSPGFTLVAVLTLTIGILATTTTVSAVNAILFRPLAIEEPAEVHQIFNGAERNVDGDTGIDHAAQFSCRVLQEPPGNRDDVRWMAGDLDGHEAGECAGVRDEQSVVRGPAPG